MSRERVPKRREKVRLKKIGGIKIEKNNDVVFISEFYVFWRREYRNSKII